MFPDAARMGTNIAELQQLLAKKDVRIRELEVENMTLRSQLDKYHSVFQLGDGKRHGIMGTGIPNKFTHL